MKNKKTLAITAVVIIFIVAIFYRLSTNEAAKNWVTGVSKSPTDIVEIAPGQYRVRGVERQSVEGRNPQTSVVAQPAYQNPMPINDYQWHGVQCLQQNMRITSRILTPGVWWQVRFDGDDRTIMDLYPKDWKGQHMLVVTNSYNLQEWRIKPGSTNTHALVAWEITPDTGVPPR